MRKGGFVLTFELTRKRCKLGLKGKAGVRSNAR